jgi:Protein of unknown function (DUF2799)
MMRAAATLIMLLSVVACSAFELSDAECRSTNWYERGHQDGFGGHPTQIVRLRQQCAEHGVKIAERDYLEGWRTGHNEWDRLIGSMQNRR